MKKYIKIKVFNLNLNSLQKGGASLAVGEEDKTNIIILGRSVNQQIGKSTFNSRMIVNYEDSEEGNMELFINRLYSIPGINLKKNIDIYFCDKNDESPIIEKTIGGKNIRFIHVKCNLNNYQEVIQKLPLKEQVDIIVNDLSTMKSFNLPTIAELIRYYLKIGGQAYLQGFREKKMQVQVSSLKLIENDENFNIFVRHIDNTSSTISVNSNTTIREIYQHLKAIGKTTHQLMFAGKLLELDKSISSYRIYKEATLNQVVDVHEHLDISMINMVNHLKSHIEIKIERITCNDFILGHPGEYSIKSSKKMCLKITKIKTEDQKVSATTESHNWGPGRRLGPSPAEIKFEEQKKKNKENYEKNRSEWAKKK